MDTIILKRFNTKLGDLRGRNPHGHPIYRWFHSRELTYPVKTSTGYAAWRQVDEDRWLVAMWQAPPSRTSWENQFPDLGYPAQGIYYATDMMLLPGIEPSDSLTDQASGYIKAFSAKTMKDHLSDIEQSRERREANLKKRFGDMVDDACTAFDNVPGKRGGHVSFGGTENKKETKIA